MSIRLHSLEIYNYKLIANANLQFDPYGKYLIVGENQDAITTSDSNGSGKTTFLDAICWGASGKSITKCKANDIIGPIDTKCYVILTIEAYGKIGKIERIREGSTITLKTTFYDGENGVTQTDTQTKLQLEVLKFLFPFRCTDDKDNGFEFISRLLFLSSFKIDELSSSESDSTGRMKIVSYLLDNVGTVELKKHLETLKERRKEINTKVKIISESIISDDEFNKISNSLKTLINSNKDRLVSVESLHGERENNRAKIKAILEKLSSQRELLTKNREETTKLREVLKQQQTLLNNDKQKLVTVENNYNSYNLELEESAKALDVFENVSMKLTKVAEIKKELTEKEVSRDKIKADIRQFDKDIVRLEAGLTIECTNCGTALIIIDNKVVDNSKSLIIELTAKRDNSKQDLNIVESTIKSILKELTEIDLYTRALETYNKRKKKLDDLNYDVIKRSIFNNIETLDNKISMIEDDIKDLEEQGSKLAIDSELIVKQQELNKKIEELTTKLEEEKKVIAKNELEIGLYEEKIATNNKSVSSFQIGQKALKIADDWINLTKIYTTMRFQSIFSAFEMEADTLFGKFIEGGNLKFEVNNLGETNAEFNILAKLSTDEGYRELYTFSSGENRRFGFSTILAARNILTNADSLGLLMMDEVLDKLDTTGRFKFAEYLLSSDEQLFLVSHTDDINNLFANKINIVKSNGVSEVFIQ